MVRKVLLLLCSVLLTGCVPVDSLNPLYSDKNVIFDPALVGEWVGDNPDEGSLRIDHAENDAYQLVLAEKKDGEFHKETVFEAHLVSLGGEKYLDVVAKQLEGMSNQLLFHLDSTQKGAKFMPGLERIADGIYLEVLGPTSGKSNTHTLQLRVHPAHWIYKVEVGEKHLSLAYLDREWVKDAIDKKVIQARHIKDKRGDNAPWVLSGSTSELQQLVVQAADAPGAFSGGMAMRRVEQTKGQ